MATSSRLLALLSLLQAPREWPAQVLADRLDITPRTVRRDVDRLRELGYQITALKGPGGGYRLAPGSELPPLLFDDDQAVAIAVALQSAPVTGVDIDDAAARALGTLRQVLPSRLRHRIDGIRFTAPPSAARVDPGVLAAASGAVRARQVLRFDYRDGDGPPRRTEPHAVVVRHGRWYLVAWDLERVDWRVFRLDRMRPRTPAGPSFTPRPIPGGDASAFLAATFKGSEQADRWPCVGEFVVQLPACDVATWVPDAEVEVLGDRSCRVVAGSWSWAGLVALIVRLDVPVEVLRPAAFVEAAATVGRRLSTATSAPRGVGEGDLAESSRDCPSSSSAS